MSSLARSLNDDTEDYLAKELVSSKKVGRLLGLKFDLAISSVVTVSHEKSIDRR